MNFGTDVQRLGSLPGRNPRAKPRETGALLGIQRPDLQLKVYFAPRVK